MNRFFKMLIVSFVCFLTCDLQAQIKSNEAKPKTENMPESSLKVGKIPTNMQTMENKCSRKPKCSNSREVATKENPVANNNTRKQEAGYESGSPRDETTDETTDETAFENEEVLDVLLEEVIGSENKKIIANATAIRLYELESPRKTRSTNYFQDFAVIDEKDLTELEAKTIKHLLLSTETYSTGGFVKQCLFLPKMGVEFMSESGNVKVLISVLCDVVHFYQDEENYNAINSDNGHEAMVEFYQSAFPKASINLQKMDLPSSPQPIFYTAKEGDNLFKIAQQMSKQYNQEITTDLLLQWNNCTDADKLAIGHQLIVGFKEENCK